MFHSSGRGGPLKRRGGTGYPTVPPGDQDKLTAFEHSSKKSPPVDHSLRYLHRLKRTGSLSTEAAALP